MIREEAAKEIKKTIEQLSVYMPPDDDWMVALTLAISALRTRQAHTRLDRRRWVGCELCSATWSKKDWCEGGAHDFRIDGNALLYYDEKFGWEGITIKFCPNCGRPLTEEAWAELERRIGGNDGTTD